MTEDKLMPTHDLQEVVAYLLGERALEGFWFGEPLDQDARPAFWWRSHLRRAMQAARTEPACKFCGAVNLADGRCLICGADQSRPATPDDLVERLWARRHELTEAEWLEAAPILLGMIVAKEVP